MSLLTLRPAVRSCALRGVRYSSTRIPYPERLAFAFDIDGVLKQGKNVLPQAKRVMQFLTGADGRLERPVPFLLMTNGGGTPDALRQRMLSTDLGVEIGEHQLVQSHTPLRDLVHKYADETVLVVGGPRDSARRVAESYGLKRAVLPQDILHWNKAVWDRTELTADDESFVRHDIDLTTTPIKAIFVLHDSHDWGRDLSIINELMQSDGGLMGTVRPDRRKQPEGGEVPLWFSNPDLEWKSDYPVVRLGQGAFSLSLSAIYKAATGLELPYTQFGKPYPATYDFADKMLRRQAKFVHGSEGPLNVYMIGDNPLSDIQGANAHGWDSILLSKTGVYDGLAPPTHEPTFIADDVELAVEWAVRRELKKQAAGY